MVAFLALPILALMSSELLLVLVLMTPRYLKEFTLDIVSPSTSIDTFACSSPTTIRLVFRAFIFVVLSSQHPLPTLFISCGDLPFSAVALSRPISSLAPYKHRRDVEIECITAVGPTPLSMKKRLVCDPFQRRLQIVSHREYVSIQLYVSELHFIKYVLFQAP